MLLIEHNMQVVMAARRPHHRARTPARSWPKARRSEIRANAAGAAAYLGTAPAMDELALTISGLDCFYGEVQVLHGLSLELRQRRGALPARPQRRRQDDDAEGDHGAGAGARRLDPARTACELTRPAAA